MEDSHNLSFDPKHFQRLKEQQKRREMKDIFGEIYQHNHWKGKESVSGPGSSMEQTANIRKELPGLLKSLRVKSLLDVPCGDFQWMSHASLPVDRYMGGDIVAALVQNNKQNYEDDSRYFFLLNLIEDPLPKADALFCRDCLVHFSFDDIEKALLNIKQSEIGYLITTTFPDRDHNTDIVTGDWRPLNMEKAPFYFPSPIHLLNEGCTENEGRYVDKSMGFWRLDQLV